jgi:hypothetical protein
MLFYLYDKGHAIHTKGWVCKVADKKCDWLGPYTRPPTKKVWMRRYARLAIRIRSLMKKSNTPLQSVMKCDLSLPVSRRNYERSRERNSM